MLYQPEALERLRLFAIWVGRIATPAGVDKTMNAETCLCPRAPLAPRRFVAWACSRARSGRRAPLAVCQAAMTVRARSMAPWASPCPA